MKKAMIWINFKAHLREVLGMDFWKKQ